MIDYKRLFGGLLVLLVVQWGAEYLIGPYIRTLPQYILSRAFIDYLCSLALNLFYVPKGYRKNAMRSPDFHRQVLTYFMIFFIISIIQMFVFNG